MNQHYTDMITSMIDLFDTVDVSASPNYRATIIFKEALAHRFGNDLAIQIIGRMKIDVSNEAIETENFPDLIRSMVNAVARMREHLIKDVGRTYADQLLVNMCDRFALEMN